MKLFLAPHMDDESLFGAFTIMREKPTVVIVLGKPEAEVLWTPSIDVTTRRVEAVEALTALGVTDWQGWPFSNIDPDWQAIRALLGTYMSAPDVVYAPAWQADGHPHHNAAALAAAEVFGAARVISYCTYGRLTGKNVTGERVIPTPEEAWTKLQALSCYRSQITHPQTVDHFLRDQYEYLI